MPSWKKVIISGSSAELASLTVTSNITSSGLLVTGSTAGNLVRITQTGTGNAFVVEDSTNPDASSFTIDATGRVYIGGSTITTMSPAPKLDVSGSVAIAGKIQIGDTTDTFYEYQLYSGDGPIFARHVDPLIGTAAIVGVSANSADIGPTLGTYIGVEGAATAGDDDDPASTYIGGTFYAGGNVPSNNYAVRLQDGSQGIGKVLVSQTADGKARWSTSLSGSYEITGSLKVTGSAIISGSTTVNGALSITSGSSVSFTSSNSSYSGRMHVSNLPNPLGTSTVSSPLSGYGAVGEGLYIQFGGGVGDEGGIKITDDGVAVFGAGDTDLFKVVNEDTNQQIFVINDVNQVGINKAFTPGASTPMNATLDVNGNAIITGSLTTTGDISMRYGYDSFRATGYAYSKLLETGYDGTRNQDFLNIYTAGTGTGNANPQITVFRDTGVGIGTTSPNAKLDVNGNALISGSLTVTGSYVSPAGNTINSNALIQASLLYLSNNF